MSIDPSVARKPLNPLLSLNAAQRAAVEHPDGPLLVVAGAGSGKTRVLTARVQQLLERGVPPEAVVAFTFTNRAAREMRARIETTVGEVAARLWVGTFHGIAVRILRREAPIMDRPREFAIFDREDQETVLRGIVRRLELPEAAFRLGAVLGKISDAKNAMVTPVEMAHAAVTPHARQVAECYRLYQEALRASGAFDFDDLIVECVRLFERGGEISDRYRRRFRHVLVDEYQDTNHAQFRMVRALAEGHGNVFVVGDDDQSIYGWRGADLSNVLDFESTFPGAEVVRLEQNYRSTAGILAAANAVIANNHARKGKTLWCERELGAPLQFVLAGDETDEARHIRAALESRRARGGRLDECAVLYRTNAQSRAIETELRQRKIPYEIVGGVSFYQRREVKDLLAYLRVAVNPADAVSFWRIWNTPRRGLGPAVRVRVEAAMSAGVSALEALRGLMVDASMPRAARTGTGELLALIDELRARRGDPAEVLLLLVLERTGYMEHLSGEEAQVLDERRANIEELVAAAAQFSAEPAGALEDFLAESALVTDMDRVDPDADRVLMLTAHNAKGLEFPMVIVAGLEEGLFPHGNSLDEAARLEEERRLFYVAITRARNEVLLTAAAYRRRFSPEGGFVARGGAVSRFVDEIPAELLTRVETPSVPRLGHPERRPARSREEGTDEVEWEEPVTSGAASNSLKRSGPHHRALGKEVFHEVFGRGVVMEAEGNGSDTKFTVRFGTQLKKVMGRFLTGGSDGD